MAEVQNQWLSLGLMTMTYETLKLIISNYVWKLVIDEPTHLYTRSFYVRFEVVTKINMKFTVFRDITSNLCREVPASRRHLLPPSSGQKSFFCSEDEGRIFFPRNIAICLSNYTAPYSRRL
jgi:hypothetical protein